MTANTLLFDNIDSGSFALHGFYWCTDGFLQVCSLSGRALNLQHFWKEALLWENLAKALCWTTTILLTLAMKYHRASVNTARCHFHLPQSDISVWKQAGVTMTGAALREKPAVSFSGCFFALVIFHNPCVHRGRKVIHFSLGNELEGVCEMWNGCDGTHLSTRGRER